MEKKLYYVKEISATDIIHHDNTISEFDAVNVYVANSKNTVLYFCDVENAIFAVSKNSKFKPGQLALIPDTFYNKYIESGKKINSVMLTVDESGVPVRRANNTVIVSRVKDSFSVDEVFKFIETLGVKITKQEMISLINKTL